MGASGADSGASPRLGNAGSETVTCHEQAGRFGGFALARRRDPGERGGGVGELGRDVGQRARLDARQQRPIDRREAARQLGDGRLGVGLRLGGDDPADAARFGEGAHPFGERREIGVAGERQWRGARGLGERRRGHQRAEREGDDEARRRASAGALGRRRVMTCKRWSHWSP